MQTNSYPESQKFFCEKGTTYKCMGIFYTTRGNNKWDNMAHLGTERATELIKSRFYWPLMWDDIKHFVTQVCPCVKRKKSYIMKTAAMQSVSAPEPLEIISLDFLQLDKLSGGHQYLFGVTDNFTKFTQYYATRNKEQEWTVKLRPILEDKVHILLETYGENLMLYRVEAEDDPNRRTKNLHCNMLQPCDELLDNFKWNFTKNEKRKAESAVVNKTKK